MDEPALRLLRVGLPQPNRRGRLAVFLVSVMLLSMMQPVSGNVTVARDDFGVLDAFAATLEDRAAEGESLVAIQGAQSAFALVDASKRPVQSGDALADAQPAAGRNLPLDVPHFLPRVPAAQPCCCHGNYNAAEFVLLTR